MTKTGFPPVPQGLREMLKDYPELIDQLQRALNRVVEKPSPGTPPFERAIWILEDTLSSFISEARKGIKAAEEDGDTAGGQLADAKFRLMLRARSASTGGGMMNLDDLWSFFEDQKDAQR